jgi:hypothetical protein
MGYLSLLFRNPGKVDLSAILLIQKVDESGAVIIDPDIWTRVRKENYFKRYFLGSSELAESSTIVDVDRVKFRFHLSTAMLSARFKVSIKVEYKEFDYLIEVEVEVKESLF